MSEENPPQVAVGMILFLEDSYDSNPAWVYLVTEIASQLWKGGDPRVLAVRLYPESLENNAYDIGDLDDIENDLRGPNGRACRWVTEI